MKRVVCLLLSLLLLLAVVPVQALAADAPRAEGKKLIAITFDDGPSFYTEKLLDGLDRLEAKVTFFSVGNRVSGNTAVLKRAYLAGHQIGSHSWDHSDLTGLSDSGIRSQFTRSYEALNAIFGSGTTYLTRAPYGSTSSRVRGVVNTPFIDWSVDTRDWDLLNTAKVRDHIVQHAFDGAIVLLHDLYSSSVNGALEAIEILKKQGYEFVTVNALFRRRDVALKDGEEYSRCSPTGSDLGAVQVPTITYQVDAQGLQVTIRGQKGAKIYYNTNGGDFYQNSTAYTGPFYVKADTTVTAIAAFALNGDRSETVQSKITRVKCAAPTITIVDGIVTLSGGSSGAQYFYTTNGGVANTGSQVYTGPVAVAPGTVVSAVAGGDAFITSSLNRLYYSYRKNLLQDVFPWQWYCDVVDRAASEKLMLGNGGNSYFPNRQITRGEFVVLLYRLAGTPDLLPDGTSYTFWDVPQTEFYADAVQWAYENGIMEGYNAHAFRPNTCLTREQAGKTAYRYLTLLGITVPDAEGAAASFLDSEEISDYAIAGMDALVAAGILEGTPSGYIRPQYEATRAEAMAILLRLRDYAKKNS